MTSACIVNMGESWPKHCDSGTGFYAPFMTLTIDATTVQWPNLMQHDIQFLISIKNGVKFQLYLLFLLPSNLAVLYVDDEKWNMEYGIIRN